MRKELSAILARAEAEVRDLLARALERGDYEDVARFAEVAGWLAERRVALDGTVVEGGGPKPETAAAISSAPESSNARRGPSEPVRRTQYPRFVREGDRLVKVGWSRSSATTYEHKAGRSLLDAVVARIADETAKKKVFTVDDIESVQMRGTDSTIPSYQLYLCIAWLKDVGLLRDMGRRRYGVADRKDLRTAVAKYWEKLEQR